jgi:hypothetical protein
MGAAEVFLRCAEFAICPSPVRSIDHIQNKRSTTRCIASQAAIVKMDPIYQLFGRDAIRKVHINAPKIAAISSAPMT